MLSITDCALFGVCHDLIHCELHKLPAGRNKEGKTKRTEQSNGNRNGLVVSLLHCNDNLIAE